MKSFTTCISILIMLCFCNCYNNKYTQVSILDNGYELIRLNEILSTELKDSHYVTSVFTGEGNYDKFIMQPKSADMNYKSLIIWERDKKVIGYKLNLNKNHGNIVTIFNDGMTQDSLSFKKIKAHSFNKMNQNVLVSFSQCDENKSIAVFNFNQLDDRFCYTF